MWGSHTFPVPAVKARLHNIPDELVTLLQKLSVDELLDFALGSNGRWYVRYRQKGPDKHELSPYLWMDLGQGSNVKLDRLTLGPDADHWGVHRATDGSFQRFSSVGNRDKFTEGFDSRIANIKSNNQIWFVSFGFNGSWAFSVNGYVQHRCGKPFHNKLAGGWKAQKRVSTIALSPMARVWIIVWDDGTLSHNLPFNIATEVEDYFQIQHSLKGNSNQGNWRRSNPQKFKSQPNNTQPGTATSVQKQQPTSTSSTQPLPTPPYQPPHIRRTVPVPLPPSKNNALPVSNPPVTLTSASSQQPATRPAATPLQTFPQVPNAPPAGKPAQATRYTAQPASQVPPAPKSWATLAQPSASQAARPISRVETISAKPKVYVPPPKMTTTLRVLDEFHWNDSYEYQKVVRLFDSGWKHQDKKRPKIKRIFAVCLPDHLNESYEAYKTRLEAKNEYHGANEKLVFHGTTRRCYLGEYEGCITLVLDLADLLFSIESGFRWSELQEIWAGHLHLFCVIQVRLSSSRIRGDQPLMTITQLRADDYAIIPSFAENKIVLVAKVALGKESIHYQTTQELTGPPYGYDSVLGEVGIDLNHDEPLQRQRPILPLQAAVLLCRRFEIPSSDPLLNQRVTAIPLIRSDLCQKPLKYCPGCRSYSGTSRDGLAKIGHRNNIPKDLEDILKNLKVQDLIDFELGSDGRCFVHFRDNDRSSRRRDLLSLGAGDIHWGIRKDTTGAYHDFCSEPGPDNDSFGKRMQRRYEQSKPCTEIDSVALGFNGDWAICAQGRVEYRSGSLFRNQLKAARQWLILYDDGSTSHNLPINIASTVDDYCRLEHSLIPSKRSSVAPTITPLFTRPSPPPRLETTLRLISPDRPEDMKEYKQGADTLFISFYAVD
ncbi:hypothetical protein M407DRAFT_7152 [Tulasnella calospora MUT 4182]|uniref:Uncharacterized protein n=1 Tax=Tulasnella calospora MUT 4182 TaxID=1051891 RepID=A0A0C3QB94_9AGAM|nr:hypothetical protein M407DRAFT_7152 [Tulasnella calospora MUT 4182]